MIDDDREYWPVHQPFAYEAPIPGLNWYSGCNPDRPKVNPETGLCEDCNQPACPICGSEIIEIHNNMTQHISHECQCREPV